MIIIIIIIMILKVLITIHKPTSAAILTVSVVIIIIIINEPSNPLPVVVVGRILADEDYDPILGISLTLGLSP